MNSRWIKLVAAGSMLVDHIGDILLPHLVVFRIIGRIAMPLFCFLIAYGATKTRNLFKYFLRLFIFAIATQLWLNLVIFGNVLEFGQLNVFFTLSLGALSIWFIRKFRIYAFSILFISLIIVTVSIVHVILVPIDYHIAGLVLIIMFYLGFMHSLQMVKIAAVPILLVFNLLIFIISPWTLQWVSIASAILIFLFKDVRLRISVIEKWAFYLFYPLHLTLLYILA